MVSTRIGRHRLSESPYFHVGILVSDIEEAMARYSPALDVTFVRPTIVNVPHLEYRGERSEVSLRLAYTTQGPAYYELIEMIDEGFYGRWNGQGIHHVGVWEADVEARVRRLTASGLELEAAQYSPEGRFVAAYLNPGDLNGLRVELVDEGRRRMMEDWIRGSAFEDFPDEA